MFRTVLLAIGTSYDTISSSLNFKLKKDAICSSRHPDLTFSEESNTVNAVGSYRKSFTQLVETSAIASLISKTWLDQTSYQQEQMLEAIASFATRPRVKNHYRLIKIIDEDRRF